jgi:hypothetical protein
MKKTTFEQDIIDVLKKYGFKTDGIKQLYLKFQVNEIPEIEMEYFII